MAEIPAPIPDRLDEVGGIESIIVDGRRWFFGFCYSMDIAVSPLIDDPGVMAAFASKHMLQRDGAHDVAFWRELVDLSVENSDLVEDDADRTFDSATLAANRLTPDYHLLYLLGAATLWDGKGFFDNPAVRDALRAVGVRYDDPGDAEWDCIDTCKAALQDPGKATAATFVMNRYLEFVLERMPANWPRVFSALRP
jgi:hypothetical protein